MKTTVLDNKKAISFLLPNHDNLDQKSKTTIEDIIRSCGNKEFPLNICKNLNDDGITWEAILEKINSNDFSFFRNAFDEDSLENIMFIEIFFSFLDEPEKELITELNVFCRNTKIPDTLFSWIMSKEGDKKRAKQIIKRLKRFRFIDFFNEGEESKIVINEELSKYLGFKTRKWVGSHKKVLSFYNPRISIDNYEVGSFNWSEIDNDGFVFRNLTYHLHGGDFNEELRYILTSFNWIYTKLINEGVKELIIDFDFLGPDDPIRIVQAAIRKSSQYLVDNPSQLPSQLLGRIDFSDDPNIKRLIDETREFKKENWIKPYYESISNKNDKKLLTLRGHAVKIVNLVSSHDGRFLCSVSQPFANLENIVLWDLNLGLPIGKWKIDDHIRNAEIDSKNRKLYIAGALGSIYIIDFDNDNKINEIELNNRFPIKGIRIAPDAKNIIVLYDRNEGFEIYENDFKTKIYFQAEFNGDLLTTRITSDGMRVVFSDGKKIKIFDLEKKSICFESQDLNNKLESISISSDNNYGLCCDSLDNIFLFDLRKMKVTRLYQREDYHIETGGGPVISLFNKYGQYYIVKNYKNLEINNLETHFPILKFRGDMSDVTTFIKTDDNSKLVTGYQDGSIIVWDLKNLSYPTKLYYYEKDPYNNGFRKAYVFPTSEWVILESYWGFIDVLNAKNFHREKLFSYSKNSQITPCFNGDGSVVFGEINSYKEDEINKVVAWETKTGNKINEFEKDIYIANIKHFQQSNTLLIGYKNGEIVLWDYYKNKNRSFKLKDDEEIQEIETFIRNGNEYIITSASYSPIRIWDAKTFELVQELEKTPQNILVHTISVSVVKNILIGIQASRVFVWDLKSSKIENRLSGKTGIDRYAFSHDNKYLITGSGAGEISVLDLNTFENIYSLNRVMEYANEFTIDPSNKFAACGSIDGKLVLWNLQDGEIIAELNTDDPIEFCSFIPEKPLQIIAGHDNKVHYFEFVERDVNKNP